MKRVFHLALHSFETDAVISENKPAFGNESSMLLSPKIDIRPGVTPKVNEEVFFSAENTTYCGKNHHDSDDDSFKQAIYEWDFGDGYTLQYGKPDSDSQYSAIAATHYYMKPGTFTVTLHVGVYESYKDGVPVGRPIAEATEKVALTVSGIEPLEGFELLCAPISSRIAQKMTVLVPEKATKSKDTKLTVVLKGKKGSERLIFEKTNPCLKETFLFRVGELSADSYRLTATLQNGKGRLLCNGKKKGVWIEFFEKDFDGVPSVGINENNALCVNGKLFFPVTPFVLNRAPYDRWTKCVNTMYGVGYDAEGPNTTEVFSDYLDRAADKNYRMIGPTRGDYTARRHANKDLVGMRQFVKTAKNYENFLMYEWQDEPNLGTKAQKVPPPTLSAWKYLVSEYDRRHPVMINYYAFNWFFNYYRGNYIEYDAVGSLRFNARHTFACDMYTSDVYPIHYRKDVRLFNFPRGPIDLWVQNIDTTADNFFHMLPYGVFIEVTCIQKTKNEDGGYSVPPVTASQVLMEAWLAIIHGAKMINFFQHFQDDLIQYEAMEEVKRAIDTYQNILLGPTEVEQITSNSRVRTNRVDTLTRRDKNDIYLFAVRLTEPDPIAGETYNALSENREPESIETVFSVPNIETGLVRVLDETGTVLAELPLENGKFTDTFAKEAYHIYRISPLPTPID